MVRSAVYEDRPSSRLLRLFAWSALMAPLGIILNELGHFLVARALGFPAKLHAASVSGGAQIQSDPNWMVAAQAGAGPAVTVMLILFALYMLRGGKDRPWAFALAATAPLRFLVGVSYLGVAIYIWWVGGTADGGFDEANFARAAGVSVIPLLVVQTFLLSMLWFWLAKSIPHGMRTPSIAAILTGGLTSTALWMSLGPLLFSLS